ncbi:MAG: hypothetical protein JWP02_3560 [Acidimicrobiales bacterium]|nr:hypothetical protein [Acidimicrobiales bacterium]
MERTHELARTICSPDLADGDYIRTHVEGGTAFPATHSAHFARALGQGARETAKKSIGRRRVDGWCKKGHQMTPENTIGRQCRRCKNDWKKHRRALGQAA